MEDLRSLLRRAHEERRVLRIAYRKTKKKDASVRELRVYAFGDWYIEAHCLLRDDNRRFRIDRIESAELLDKTFVPDRYFSEHARRKGWQNRIPSDAGNVGELLVGPVTEAPEELPDTSENSTQSYVPSGEPQVFPEKGYDPYYSRPYTPLTLPKPESPREHSIRETWLSTTIGLVLLASLISYSVYYLWMEASFLDCDYCLGMSYATTSDLPDSWRKGLPEGKCFWVCNRCKGHGEIPLHVFFLGGDPRGDYTRDRKPIPEWYVTGVLGRRQTERR